MLTGWLGGLAGRGEQVARLVGAVLPAQIAFQLAQDGIGLGGEAGAAESSRGALDRLGERRLVPGELLQDHELRVDHDHRINTLVP